MKKLMWMIGLTAGSAVGWWIGSKLGDDMVAFGVSTVGSIIGVYLGFKIGQKLEE